MNPFRSLPSITNPLMALALGCSPAFSESCKTAPTSGVTSPQPSKIEVQEITSSTGIKAWMVENHEIPVASLAITFKNAGSASDPDGLSGMVTLLSGTLDEGAGDWTSQDFKRFLLEKNIELSITASQDNFTITFRTIKENICDAFQMVRTILTKPRFDPQNIARVKNQLLTILQQSLNNESAIAEQTLYQTIYGTHPYGRTTPTTIRQFPAITPDQMRQFMNERFTRDQLLIAVVGDITPVELKDQLNKTFGVLPEKSKKIDIPDAPFLNKGAIVVETLKIPQSQVIFIQPGIKRNDPEFYAAYVMMKILGEGQFESRLWNEIRETRGLAYGIDGTLSWNFHANHALGSTATKNANVKEVINIIRTEWQRMKDTGATQAELDYVKVRMLGSFALNFSSTQKIAAALLSYQNDNLGIDFINKRNQIIKHLTLDQINSAAKSLLKPEELTFIIVGDPAHVSTKGLENETPKIVDKRA